MTAADGQLAGLGHDGARRFALVAGLQNLDPGQFGRLVVDRIYQDDIPRDIGHESAAAYLQRRPHPPDVLHQHPGAMVEVGQDVVVKEYKTIRKRDRGQNNGGHNPNQIDARGFEGGNLIVPDKKADSNKGAQKHPQRAHLINNQGYAKKEIAEDEKRGDFIFY